MSKCIIRKDLQKQGLGAPIWEKPEHEETNEGISIWGNTKRQYKWINDTEAFKIKYRNKWYFAYSIDFDFID